MTVNESSLNFVVTFCYQTKILKYAIIFLDIVITICRTVSTYIHVANEGKSEFR